MQRRFVGSGALRPVAIPIVDLTAGLERCLASGPRGLMRIVLGLLLGWWIYVPCHELLHAAGCVLTGGEVTRLEIAPIYGGRVLQRFFPFVAAGSGHAGRLTGFDTRGNDLIYLATDMAPFLLTIFPGVWALRAAGANSHAFLFGLALPVALAPFVSITGDAYEIGSILVTSLRPWSADGWPQLLRGDDLFERLSRVNAVGGARVWLGLGFATTLGIVWAFATYIAGAGIAALDRHARIPSSSIFRRSVER